MNYPSTKIKLYQKRDFNAVMNAAFWFVREHFKPFFKTQLAIAGPFAALYLIVQSYVSANFIESGSWLGLTGDQPFEYIGLSYLANIANGLFGIALALSTYGYLKVYEQRELGDVTVSDVWAEVRRHFGQAILASILVGLGAAFGFILLILPGVYLLIRWSMTLPSIVFEVEDAVTGMSRSSKLIKDKWWNTFGILIVLGLIYIAIAWVIALPAGILFGAEALLNISEGQTAIGESFSGWKYMFVVLSEVIGSFLGLSILYLGIAFQYFNLVEMKESRGLMDEIDKVGDTEEKEKQEGGEY